MSKTIEFLNPSVKKVVQTRFNIVSGHFNGVGKMLDKQRDPIEIIKQNRAIIESIKKINKIIISTEIDTNIKNIKKNKNLYKSKEKLEQILELS